MEANPLEMQTQIMHNSNTIRSALKDLHEWEDDVKRLEKQRKTENEFTNVQPIRSHLNPSTDSPKPSTSKCTADASPFDTMLLSSAHSSANEWKNKGNNCVKANDYKKAVVFYTNAIREYKFDPIYFTNRALCHLKMESYLDAIDDCSIAIHLDATSVKAYYRRMQANEGLSNIYNAMDDCENVLRLDPLNKDAKRSHELLKEKLKRMAKVTPESKKDTINEHNYTIKETSTVKIPKCMGVTAAEVKAVKVAKTTANPVPWSTFDESTDVRIDFVDKPPHLRPVQMMHTIPIRDVLSFDDEPRPPVTVNTERPSIEEIDSVISDISNNNVGAKSIQVLESNDEKPKRNKVAEKTATITSPRLNGNALNVAESTSTSSSQSFVVPKTTAQFHKMWASAESDADKFLLLKETADTNFGKLLGSQFTCDMFSEILAILNKQFVKGQIPVGQILRGMISNSEMSIFALLMSNEEKLALTQLITYMRSVGENDDLVDFVEQKFNSYLVS